MRHTPTIGMLCLMLFAAPSAAAPPAQKDTREAITRDFVNLLRRYKSSPPSTVKELGRFRSEASKLTSRTTRLRDWSSPQTRKLREAIREFKKRLRDSPIAQVQQERTAARLRAAASARKISPRKPSQRPRRKTVRQETSKKDTLVPIRGPTLREGGHTTRGLAHLYKEVERFGKRYRQVRRKDSIEGRGADRIVEFSRNYFERAIKSSMDTAVRQIETGSYDESTTYIAKRGGVVLDNYTPQENLQWAFDVADVAVRFEALVRGRPHRWRQWQTKLRSLARRHNLKLTRRALLPIGPAARPSSNSKSTANP